MRRFGPLVATLLGAVVTLALLLTMQALIGSGTPRTEAGARVRLADVTMPEARREALVEVRRPEKLPDPARPPRLQLPEPEQIDAGGGFALDMGGLPAPELRIDPGLGAGSSDGDYLPIVKVAAMYPRRAQARGITGYCIVEYTVTVSGATRDPVAIDCQPPGVFEDASVRAALKFKYRPRVVDGRAVEVRGVRNQFVYELDR
ncbi:MAG: hypothetical protein CALGDGBN_01298 [Pseudomonadales bacterium]|nr:hypothetical protein [Pseudomonadales bacterium]